MQDVYKKAMILAIEAAEKFEGNTAPNPPVGAVLLDKNNQVISIAAHEKSGFPHAEVIAIENAKKNGLLDKAHSLVVTLEPCCHRNKKTPPCAQMLSTLPISNIIIGTLDPNPEVSGKGVKLLKEAGKNITIGVESERCQKLICGFQSLIQNKRPWIILKRALNENGSMIPPVGHKTFTSHHSLVFAHKLRKKTDAILTGIGTIIKDQPEFTVRHVLDFPNRKRVLAICEGERKTPKNYFLKRKKEGWIILQNSNIHQLLSECAHLGVLQILGEAGPKLSQYMLDNNLWDEQYTMIKHDEGEDTIDYKKRIL